MVRRKPVRTRGKISLTRFFQKFKNGDRVSLVLDRSLNSNVPDRLQGRAGKISGTRGRSYIVEMKDQNKNKTYIVEPVHLKKLKDQKVIAK